MKSVRVQLETAKRGSVPYSEYVDSGIFWIAEIPKGWKIVRLKSAAKIIAGQSPEGDTVNKDGIGLPFFQGKAEFGTTNPIAENYCEAPPKIAEVGDLLVSVRAPVGDLNIADKRCGIGRGLAAIRFKNNKFVFRFLEAAKQVLVSYGTGSTFEAVSSSDIGNLLVPMPSDADQQKIAVYLDEKAAAIDEAVAKKRRQVELLKEKRAAVINQAVTKGLDPKAELIDSGVPWLGRMPKGWEIKKLRHVTEMIVSNVDKLTSPDELPVRLCNYVDVYKNEVIHEGLPFMVATATPYEISNYRIRIDDVLITKDSEEWNDIGVPAYVAMEASDLVSGYHLAILRSHKRVMSGRFLAWQLRGAWAKAQFSCRANGITRYALSHGAIKDLKLVIPSFSDQQKIAAYLDEKTAAIDRALAEIGRSIELLTEYRSSLITNVVTGKVAVS